MASFFCVKLLRHYHIKQGLTLSRQFCISQKNFEAACLTSCKELSNYLKEPSSHQRYRLLDVSWDEVEDCKQKHTQMRIPQAKFFDLNECRDKDSAYPFMLPSSQQFEDYVGDLGISSDHHVIIYENYLDFLMIPSARLWWMFRVFGHENISVLNGGLKGWMDEGYHVATGDYSEDENLPRPSNKFKATYKPELVREFEYLKENYDKKDVCTLLEARAAVHMELKDDDADISGKSIPGAIWTPFTSFLDVEKNSVRSKEEIRNYFKDRNIDLNKEVISTCEVGFTASTLAFCLYYGCAKSVPVYDGSFSEWSDRVS